MLQALALKTSLVMGAALPDFANLQTWAQDQGQAILIIAMIGLAVYFAFKREWGSLIGMILVIGLLIAVLKKPDETVIEWVQGLIDKLMNSGGSASGSGG
ncbi:TcpD family membrane protein [Enterococcus faecalis]|uniref:TcpD family membrane protein n=1 Tax=Enterococcus faecalis TaxID=1351 RepID=UPI00045B73ED|nr:TcpD family membrane protein [Enterococcus faecalis]KAJ65538.1 hypothetical protein P785_0070 [Enterococcus faecalis KS19]MBN3024541.1 hypothetical protein [Enterococcus faecalis]MBO6313374.1 hypothetical protein [Enterococcus faecalis]MCH1672898.1 TcpD family membrane protein [Enterococcus faecalis]